MPENYTQLVMRRRNLDNLPDIAIPEGFCLRAYRGGDEPAWDSIVGEMCRDGFAKAIKSHRFFAPERVKMICRGETPVATATAWGELTGGDTPGIVHMVATDPSYRGRGLGFAVTNAVLHRLAYEGKTAAYLTTDDFRVPAIKIYLKLGFKPDMTKEGHIDRWEKLHKLLNIDK